MKNSHPQDYSAYLAEFDLQNKEGKPLGLAAYLLLREKLDELSLLEIQEGSPHGIDKESLETLGFLTEELLAEGSTYHPNSCGEGLLSLFLEQEFTRGQEDPEEMESSDCLHDDFEEVDGIPPEELLFEEIFGDPMGTPTDLTDPHPTDRDTFLSALDGFEENLDTSFEASLSPGRSSSSHRGRAPDSRMRRELWRLRRRREQG
ncbi:MAG TPA: hypothetical protein ENK02_09190 [Planctomycetes bacterium]|nr:hypothetical protein [Planctomycetota bacterium]